MNNFPPPPPGGEPPYEPPTQQMPAQPQPGQPPAYQPPPDPLAELDKKRKKQVWTIAGIGAVLIVVAFFGGKALEKKNYEQGADGYNAIYQDGQKAGTSAGTKAGQAAGQKEGVAQGTEQGKQQGQAQGTKDGASAALGNFSTWSTDTPYVVLMEKGPSDSVPYAVGDRTLMQPDTYYKICASGTGVCTESDPNSGGGATGQ